MGHTCQALLLRCMDFRFEKAIEGYIKDKNLLNNCDLVSIAGAAKNIVNPAHESDKECVSHQFEISKRLHETKEIILMNHTDCGAYGGRKAFFSDEEEHEKHATDMKKAKEALGAQYPDMTIRMVLAKIDSEGNVTFEEIAE